MTNKRFAVLSLVMMLAFAALSAGGCGSSSSSNSSSTDTASEIPDMLNVLSTDEFNVALAEVEAELREEGIDPDTYEGPDLHLVFISSGGRAYIDDEINSYGSAAAGFRSSATLPEAEISRIASSTWPEI